MMVLLALFLLVVGIWFLGKLVGVFGIGFILFILAVVFLKNSKN